MLKRRVSLDYLKFIGLACLVIAHINAPKVIAEIRSFDVPLMVFISGLLAKESFSRSNSSSDYVIKRIERLVVPTYIFLIGFYFCMFLVGQLPSFDIILHSFLFQRDSGIAGYVWIIWIYVLCAMLTPAIIRINNSFRLILFIILFFTYEIIAYQQILVGNRLVYYSFYSAVPYGLLLTIGIIYSDLNKYQKMLIVVGCTILHILLQFVLYRETGSYVSINEYKYPARFYYFSYSLPISIVLYEVLNKLEISQKLPMVKGILFISKHSLWVYLWHVFFLAVINYVFPCKYWITRLLVVFTMSVFTTWAQNKVVEILRNRRERYIYKYFVC